MTSQEFFLSFLAVVLHDPATEAQAAGVPELLVGWEGAPTVELGVESCDDRVYFFWVSGW